jgi:hypothetical protein
MDLRILDEVAYFFVDQFDNLYGMLVDRTDVRRIRKAADDLRFMLPCEVEITA